MSACRNTRTVVSRRIRNVISIYFFHFHEQFIATWKPHVSMLCMICVHDIYSLCHLYVLACCMEADTTRYKFHVLHRCHQSRLLCAVKCTNITNSKNVTSNLFFVHCGLEDPGIESRWGARFSAPIQAE